MIETGATLLTIDHIMAHAPVPATYKLFYSCWVGSKLQLVRLQHTFAGNTTEYQAGKLDSHFETRMGFFNFLYNSVFSNCLSDLVLKAIEPRLHAAGGI